MTPKISVIVCTYNRAVLLRRAIESLLEQSLDRSQYEIVLVDNASTDDTRAVIKSFQAQDSSPAIISLYEPTQGLGHARNTGCNKATGRYLAFTDDDCVADKQWLESLLVCYENVQPEPWSVGGPVMPSYDRPKPVWFKDSYEMDTWGEQPRSLRKGESFTGCNMSFRKDVIDRFGGFDAALGMKGDKLALAEETKLYRTIWSAGVETNNLYYTRRAIVYHTIDPCKMTVSYQLKRAFAAGQVSYDIARMESLISRCLLFIGSFALIFWYSIKALLYVRPGYWQRWAIEELRPVVANIGRLFAFIGIRMVFRQRISAVHYSN